ncbi:unnamed protein product [Polarella glacialis]|uniref:Nucleotide-diphospho-sugar transferase domain-containing protein n=1 Tax=Polarella glacialis TaxID=89957 RepID=A0A813GLX6_POLGL|nr:unnamed protein product [Polarella glacialis]
MSVGLHAPGLRPHFCVVALDREAEDALQQRGVCAVRYVGGGSLAERAAEKWDFKKRLLNTALVLGLEALVLDADSVLLGDPFAIALWRDSDLETGTDHFFPERDLWQPYVRPEENLNTGFLYGDGQSSASGGGRVFCFLARQTGWLWGAFNKFVLAHLAQEPPGVTVLYKESVSRSWLPKTWPAERLAVAKLLSTKAPLGGLCPSLARVPLRIRVLDPEEVAHGMNFFWRATHLARPDRRPPAFVHANGVDDKLYFMRDRGIWQVDDWAARFPEVPRRRFLRYEHPRGLNLSEDFATLLSALELAVALKRRLVLPRTMRCANSPAHAAYNLSVEDCTVDHFASAKILFHYHGDNLVEASLVDNLHFQSLESSSRWVAGARDTLHSLLEDPRTASAAVLVLGLGLDVRQANEAVAKLLQGSSTASPSPPRCKFAYWPGRQMACRDEAFMRHFGEQRSCGPRPGQEGCGVRGFACCEVFHGWAEKLEFFTGLPWDLPCNCGLAEQCAQYERTSDYPQLTANHRCCHLRHEDPPTLQCFDIGSFPRSNPMMDFNSYSSDVLWAFDAGLLAPREVFEACSRWTEAASVSMGLSTKPHDVGRDCTWLVSAFLLVREQYGWLVDWLDFMIKEIRRPLWAKDVVTVTMLNGMSDGNSYSLFKLQHDIQQLEFLLKEAPSRGIWVLGAKGAEGNASLSWVSDSLLPMYLQLLEATRAGRPKQELQSLFNKLEGVFNRALFLDIRSEFKQLEDGSITDHVEVLAPSAAAMLSSAGLAMSEDTVLVVDDALSAAAFGELRWALLASSAWFGAQQGREGVLLWASLLDGLHSPVLLALASELRRLRPDLLGSHPLRDVVARKYHASAWPASAMSPHALDAEVVACIWASPSEQSHSGGLRILQEEAPADWSEERAFDWAREEAPRDEAPRKGERLVALLPNRLVLWPGRRLVQPVPDSGDRARSYEESRLEVYLLFGSQRRWEQH